MADKSHGLVTLDSQKLLYLWLETQSVGIRLSDKAKYFVLQHNRIIYNNNKDGYEPWCGHFKLQITLLFVVKRIKCGY